MDVFNLLMGVGYLTKLQSVDLNEYMSMHDAIIVLIFNYLLNLLLFEDSWK